MGPISHDQFRKVLFNVGNKYISKTASTNYVANTKNHIQKVSTDMLDEWLPVIGIAPKNNSC